MDEFVISGRLYRNYSWGSKGREINVNVEKWYPTIHCSAAFSEDGIEGIMVIN